MYPLASCYETLLFPSGPILHPPLPFTLSPLSLTLYRFLFLYRFENFQQYLVSLFNSRSLLYCGKLKAKYIIAQLDQSVL